MSEHGRYCLAWKGSGGVMGNFLEGDNLTYWGMSREENRRIQGRNVEMGSDEKCQGTVS